MFFNRLPLQIFDARHWNGFEGCWNLVKGNPMFSDAEIEEAEVTISKYKGKSVQVAYDRMMKSLEDIKKQPAITTLLVYCGIYSTYYYLEDGITPYQFISWAKDRDSILVPEDMLYWYERKKENVPSTQLSRAKKRVSELETQIEAALQQIADLKQNLVNTKSELEEASRRADEAEEKLSESQSHPSVKFDMSPAQKAALARSEKALVVWKEVFLAMMQVYHRCMVEGENPRQAPDFYAMFNELNAELTDTQMAFFRSSLPEGYSDKDGGKPGKV